MIISNVAMRSSTESSKSKRTIPLFQKGPSNAYTHAAVTNVKETQQLALKLEALDIKKKKEWKRFQDERQNVMMAIYFQNVHPRVEEKKLPSLVRHHGECYTSEESAVSLRKKLALGNRPRNPQHSQIQLQQLVRSTSPRMIEATMSSRSRGGKADKTKISLSIIDTPKSLSSPSMITRFNPAYLDPSRHVLFIKQNGELLREKIRLFYKKFKKGCITQDHGSDTIATTDEGDLSTVNCPESMDQPSSRTFSLPAITLTYNQHLPEGGKRANELRNYRYLRVINSPVLVPKKELNIKHKDIYSQQQN